MSPHTVAMALAGAANLVLAGTWMFAALLGSNGLSGLNGGVFLACMALMLVLLWGGGLVLARRVTVWGLERGWNAAFCVVLATLLAVTAWLVLAMLATLVLAIAGG
jgi:hypothetical protein